LQLAAQEAVCRPRIDIRIPTSDPARNYQWGTMEDGSTVWTRGHPLAGRSSRHECSCGEEYFLLQITQLDRVDRERLRAPVFNRSLSGVGPHQSPIRIKALENSHQRISFPPLAVVCPRKLSVPRRVQGSRITDPLAHPCGRPTQLWLTAWAYHLIKSFPSCRDFRDGAATQSGLVVFSQPLRQLTAPSQPSNFSLRQTPW
jgi:hypothetical protein